MGCRMVQLLIELAGKRLGLSSQRLELVCRLNMLIKSSLWILQINRPFRNTYHDPAVPHDLVDFFLELR
jgi:hypothetical protein